MKIFSIKRAKIDPPRNIPLYARLKAVQLINFNLFLSIG